MKIDALIQHAQYFLNNDTLDDIAHEQVLTALENENTRAKLTLPDVIKAINYLQNAVLYTAVTNDYSIQRSDNPQDKVVDEAKFPREIALLHTLSEHVQYSPIIEKFLEERMDAMLLDPQFGNIIISALNDLSTATPTARDALLNDFVTACVSAMSPIACEGLTLSASVDDNNASHSAVTNTQLELTSEQISHSAEVQFSGKLFNGQNPVSALVLAFHESVHIALAQCAVAQTQQKITEDHPLYADSILRRGIYEHDMRASPFIESSYRADGEEALVYKIQDRFIAKLTAA